MEEITEEADYVNAPEGPADKKATRPGLRFFLPIAVCWIILLAIMGLRIYLTSELSEDNAKQTAEILNLTSRIQELETRENLTDQSGNLTQAVLESNVKDLNKLNQELETKKKNLTQQIQNMETNRNELNISRAQWSIDSYCLGNTDKKCQPCQFGWGLIGLSCYAIKNPPGWKTWEEAREDCKGKNSDLAVARNPAEKEAINTYSVGIHEYWIGLRVVNKKWEWVDGSDLTNSSWIDPPDPADGRCAKFVKDRHTWFSVSCDWTYQWICQKKALSV